MGLDIASATGAAFDGEDSGIPRLLTFRAPSPTGDNQNGWDYGRTFGAFHVWLAELVATVKPQAIALEAPLVLAGVSGVKVLTSQTTVRILFGLAAIAEMTASEAGVDVYEVNVATAKKHFAGHGRADKQMMLARCRQLRWNAKTDHEADAAAVWSFLKSLKEPKWAPRATPLFARGAA